MERRGRIPVAKFRTQEGKTRSRSRVRDPDYNEQDPETDLFTLLEDNIALKEDNKALKVQLEEDKKSQNELKDENTKLTEQLQNIKKQYNGIESDLKEMTIKFDKSQIERNVLDKLHKMQSEKINSLTLELKQLERNSLTSSFTEVNTVTVSSNFKSKLLKVLPTPASTSEMESIVEANEAPSTVLTSSLLENLVDEFSALKNSLNLVELQLYEANEKISELLETFRMETALIKLKQRNDELTLKNRDLIDGPSSPSPTNIKDNEEFEQIKEEVESQNRDHGERIVEMQHLMEAAIQKNTNDELKTLQLRLSILESELQQAIARAEVAESELEKYRVNEKEQNAFRPPTPPPMPSILLYKTAMTTTTTLPVCRLMQRKQNEGNNQVSSLSTAVADATSVATTTTATATTTTTNNNNNNNNVAVTVTEGEAASL
uniref:Shootin-1 n=1 Tax=Glossina austeni TaxID=7395 RepID=A0A1A9VGF1_GLOAU